MKHQYLRMAAAAAATAAMIGGAAPAALAQQQEPVTTIVGERMFEEMGDSVRVSYRDLDLTTAHDARRLHFRVKGAARQVCGPNDDRMTYRPHRNCVTFAWNGALPQMERAIQRAREIALRGTSSIPLVAIAVAGNR